MSYRTLLREPALRRLLLASVPADLADWLDYVALVGLVVYVWHEGALALALLTVAISLPYLVVGPLLAGIVDRTELRTALVAANIGRGLVTLALAFVPDLGVLLLLAFLRGVVDSAFTPARQRALQNFAPPELAAEANGLLVAINYASKIGGPALGGLLLAATSTGVVFGVNAVMSLIAAIILATLPRREPEPSDGASLWRDAPAGFVEFARRPALRLALVFVAAAYAAFFLYDTLLALLAQQFGLDPTAFGFSIAASGAGGIVGALLAGRIASRPLRLMVASIFVGGVPPIVLGALALAGVTVPAPLFLLLLAAMGACTGAVSVPYRAVIQRDAPPDRVARVFAAGEAVTITVMMAAPFIGSAIAASLGTGAAFVTGGAALLLLGIVGLLTAR